MITIEKMDNGFLVIIRNYFNKNTQKILFKKESDLEYYFSEILKDAFK